MVATNCRLCQGFWLFCASKRGGDMYSTVGKAMEMLEHLAASEHPAGVTDLARTLGWPKSNVFQMLDTLKELGYVRKLAESGRYEPTLKMWEVGTQVHSRLTPLKILTPFMRQ